ncbi:ATP-dependent DNA ligase [Salinarchaeum sp. IM2453]|uniref:ATP-dependent DNA ligase n=1 Tax=Salinarchaeum sp. IM2453 TaxID=2862870 RepID=UPI001C83FBEA|nr:ATP-dependent DNA ligase [Salinarchaeum sp. IM2453]QZA88118.1 ATP-dependent DNA ligase [Salinarchaeum sp. IM2453]
MQYADLVDVYADLEDTSSTLEKTAILSDCFSKVDDTDLPRVVRLVRGKVFAPWESEDIGISTSLMSDAIAKATGIDSTQIETWWRERGDLGNAAAVAINQRQQQPLFSESLTVEQVYETLREVATYEGDGSQQRQIDTVSGLLTHTSPSEARYLVRTVVGAMRLGVGEGLVRDAIADAFFGTEGGKSAVKQAYEVTNDFAIVAERARSGDKSALAELDVELFRPIKPMLAKKSEDIDTAVSELSDASGAVLLEAKYDGIRAKIHKQNDEIRVFTRRLEEVTRQFPDVVAAAGEQITADEYIIEAEVVAYDPKSHDPVPFQELSRRIKRKYDIDELVETVPVRTYLFDLIQLDGTSYIECPLRERLSHLEEILDPDQQRIARAEHLQTNSVEQAQNFYENVLSAGHEGVMAKNLDATYQPGSRVGYQQKIKPTMEPLDLVVTRAKWSEGRISDFLGRPYLACRNNNGFSEVGRMHTGFTDAQLEEFMDLVEPLIREVDGREAKLKPEVVLEVEYEEIQKSPQYDSGYALRFPRLKRIRHDLDPDDTDTIDRVKELYQQQS